MGPFPAGMERMFFPYQPSFLIALTGTIFFTASFLIHSVQLFKTKAWYFGIIPQAVLCMRCPFLICQIRAKQSNSRGRV